MHFSPALLLASLGLVYAQTHSGDGVLGSFGLGACGFTNNDSQFVVGLSTTFFNNFPGATTNPNDNPICGRQIQASFQGKSVTVTIVDDCVGCGQFDLNLSPAAFSVLADPSVGRIHGVSWSVIGGGE